MKAHFGGAEFDRLRHLLHDTAGLVFDETRRDSLAYSVGERLSATGCGDVSEYLELLDGATGGRERQALLDEVTIPETYFFRNPPQIAALRTNVLPRIINAARETRRIVVWSAGCSTGEEPYTIAMLIAEMVPDLGEWDIRIVGTDVSERALAAARRGRYGRRAVQLVDAETVGRWFDRAGDEFVVKPGIRRLVEFRHHNLVADRPLFLTGELDLILCRNVTIYFDRDTTRELVHRFHRNLRNGGFLFLGHAETLWQVSDRFTLVTLGDAFVYRRVDPVPVPAPRGGDRALAGPARPEPPVGESASRPPGPSLDDVRAHLRVGRYAEAAAAAADVAARLPTLAEAHYLRGMALANLGRDGEALLALRKAVFLDPGSGLAHFLLGGALARLGEPVGAARSYRAAAETLGRRPGDAIAAELGGRSVLELVALCRTLAGAEERRASRRAAR